eukprot:jgi/Ulvmu1/10308/UM060_0110.1
MSPGTPEPASPCAEDFEEKNGHNNLRDVSDVTDSFVAGMVFRSSSMHSEETRQRLNIQAVLDLRKSSRLCRKQSGVMHEMLRPDWLLMRLRSVGMHAARSKAVPSCPNCESQLNEADEGPHTKVYHVDMCTVGFKLSVFATVPGETQWSALSRALTFRSPKPPVEAAVADHDKFGGGHMYCLFLEHSKAQIAKLFFVFTDRENYPLLIHCIHGKDRTGVAVMLLMKVCGVDDDSIVDDYAKSTAAMADWQDGGEAPVPQDEVPDVYRQDMRDAIQHIHDHYGNVRTYLESCGVSNDQQATVRDILCNKMEPLRGAQ